MVLLRRLPLSASGTTLIELLVVSGLMLMVMTLMTLSLTSSRRAEQSAGRAGDVDQALRLAYRGLSRHLSRSHLLSPSLGRTAEAIEIMPYRFEEDGTISLDPAGVPALSEQATVLVKEEKLILDSGSGDDSLIANLGPKGSLRVSRLDLALLQVEIHAGFREQQPRTLSIRYHLP